MSLEILFSVAGSIAILGWIALLFAPSQWGQKTALPRLVVASLAVALGLTYAALIGAFWTSGSGGYGSLADVAALFDQRGLLLAGWVHYLAFDLLVGLWEREEAQRIGLPRWLLAPCLLLTFWFGPIGWLLFMMLRWFRLRGWSADAAVAAH